MDEALAAIALMGLFGLLIGSFLNVVVYRTPIMLSREWRRESVEFLRTEGAEVSEPESWRNEPERFNLMVPRSRCSHCGHQITALENIPVISFLILGGKCSQCKSRIGIRYPLVEVVCGVLFAWCGYRWGLSLEAVLWAGFSATLLALALIDWDTTLLPDNMTIPLLWAGLMAAAMGWLGVSLASSVWGAIAGYLSLWSVYWLFKLLTGKEGMGYGDFKLLAALGAWLGVQGILPVILISSVLGAIVGIALKFTNGLREGGYMPFGPFLAGAGLLTAAAGTDMIARYFPLILL